MGKKQASITQEELLADGWEQTDDIAFPFEKAIENRNPLNSTPEETDIKLIVHGMYNVWQFAVVLPDGGMLNFKANSMKQLKDFESKLNFYDPPF